MPRIPGIKGRRYHSVRFFCGEDQCDCRHEAAIQARFLEEMSIITMRMTSEVPPCVHRQFRGTSPLIRHRVNVSRISDDLKLTQGGSGSMLSVRSSHNPGTR